MKTQTYRAKNRDGGSAWESKGNLCLEQYDIIINFDIHFTSVVAL